MLQSLMVTAGLSAVLLLHADRAEACSEPPCRSPVRLFGSDAYVPGNLVYFKLLSSNPGELSLQTAEGAKIPASIRQIGPDRVFAPDAPIPAGTQVRLDYVEQCRSPAGSQARSYLFSTIDAVALDGPDEGSLAQREHGFIDYGPSTHDEAFVRLTHAAPARDARHLVDSHAEVDGRPVNFDDGRGLTLTLRSTCNPAHRLDPDSCGRYFRFAPGKHTVTVRYTMVGALVTLPVIEKSVEILCVDPGRVMP